MDFAALSAFEGANNEIGEPVYDVRLLSEADSQIKLSVRQAKLARSSRCKSGPGKALAGRLVVSVAWSPATTATKRTQQSCGVWD